MFAPFIKCLPQHCIKASAEKQIIN